MKILIIYATKYGCSEKCSKLLSEKIVGDVDLIDISKSTISDLSKYDKIIIGGPIYIGMMNKEIVKFCDENIELLKTKKMGLFVCSMFSGIRAEENMKKAFPEELRNIAISIKLFGGELDTVKMKFADKLITKMVGKMPVQPGESINEGILIYNIDKFAEEINNC